MRCRKCIRDLHNTQINSLLQQTQQSGMLMHHSLHDCIGTDPTHRLFLLYTVCP